MEKTNIIIKIVLVFLIILSTIDTGYSQILKRGILDTNNVYCSFDNRGSIGHRLGYRGLVWPRLNGIEYIFSMGLLLGGEVQDIHGNIVHIFNDGFSSVIDGDYEPGTTNPWGWLPLPGYDNPDSNYIALSDDSATWSPAWQAWPGKYGAGVLLADLETFWVMDDSSNAEFDYYPFSGDSSTRGLGIEVRCRGYQWHNPPFDDFIIFSYDIKNVSEKRLNKLVVGFFSDPAIGGLNDWADDLASYDVSEDLVFCWDADTLGVQGQIPGTLGFVTLDSPDSVGLTSVVAVPFGGNNRPKNDELMWNYMTPGTFSLLSQPADYVLIFGSGYFSLEIGETKTYTFACVFGLDSLELYHNLIEARNAYSILTRIKNKRIPKIPEDFSLIANYPNPFNSATIISFQVPKKIDVELMLYDLLGRKVRTLVYGRMEAGLHQVLWDGRDDAGREVTSGVYVYRLQAGDFTHSKKMLLVR